MARKIVDRHLKNIDKVFLCLDEIFYKQLWGASWTCHTVPQAIAELRKPNKDYWRVLENLLEIRKKYD